MDNDNLYITVSTTSGNSQTILNHPLVSVSSGNTNIIFERNPEEVEKEIKLQKGRTAIEKWLTD